MLSQAIDFDSTGLDDLIMSADASADLDDQVMSADASTDLDDLIMSADASSVCLIYR